MRPICRLRDHPLELTLAHYVVGPGAQVWEHRVHTTPDGTVGRFLCGKRREPAVP